MEIFHKRSILYQALPILLGLWLNLICLVSRPAWAGTAMGDLAASMQPGTWAELVTNNIGVLNQSGTDGNIIPYAADAAWDPNSRKLLYVGNDHIDSVVSQADRFVLYNADTNSWQNMSPPPWSAPGVTDHGYYQHGINTATGLMYRRGGKSSNVFYTYNIANNTWTALPPNNLIDNSAACCAGVDYFPELGGLVFAQGGDVGGGRLFLFNETAQRWSTIAQNLSPMTGGTFTLGSYNPVYKVMVFGTSGAFYKVDSSGNVARLSNAPITFYDGTGYLSIVTVDPLSGQYLVLTATDRQFYTYDVVTDMWRLQNNPTQPNLSSHSIIATPISNYGVVMFVACRATTCRTYLYKHSSTPPSSSLPSAPVSLSIQ